MEPELSSDSRLTLDEYAEVKATLQRAPGQHADDVLERRGIPRIQWATSAAAWRRAIEDELSRGEHALALSFTEKFTQARAKLAQSAPVSPWATTPHQSGPLAAFAVDSPEREAVSAMATTLRMHEPPGPPSPWLTPPAAGASIMATTAKLDSRLLAAPVLPYRYPAPTDWPAFTAPRTPTAFESAPDPALDEPVLLLTRVKRAGRAPGWLGRVKAWLGRLRAWLLLGDTSS